MTDGFVLVVNAEAGSADDDTVARVQEVLEDAGPCTVSRTATPEELDDVVADLAGRTLVVLGGDGSLHAAAAALHRADALASTRVGLVPRGTGNDFAKGLGIPLDAEEAATAACRGDVQPVDLLLADDGVVCVNATHVGIGAEAAENAAGLKERLGDAAYPVGALMAGLADDGTELTVTLDGTTIHDGLALMVGICNGPGIGGGTDLAPDADPADGLLDIVVVTATGPVARAGFAKDLTNGTHRERDDVAVHRGREVTLSGEHLRHDTDGELEEPAGRERTWRVLPGALQLVR